MEKETSQKVKQTAKAATKKTAAKASTAWQAIVKFFKELNKAYYVGAMAIIATLLFFSAWIEIPVLTQIGNFFNTSAINGLMPIPQTLLALTSSVDTQASSISGLLDYLDVSNIDGQQLNQIFQAITGIAAMLGANVADWTFNANDFIASLKEILPTSDQIYQAKALLAQISSIAKSASLGVLLPCLLVVGFNIYTIVITFWKKRVTKLCKVGFIIEVVLAAITVIVCNVINTLINSKIFFLNNIVVPSFWLWFTLIFCIIAWIVISKITKKSGEKFNKKRAGITVAIIVVVILIIGIAFAVNENNKKQPFIGNWNITNVEKQGVLDQNQINKLQENGYDLSQSVVITVKENGTFEESILGHLITGTYNVVPEGIALCPDCDINSDFAKVVLKKKDNNLTASLGIIELAEFSKGDNEAKCVSDSIKSAVGMAAIDYALKLAGVENMSAQDVVDTFNNLKETIDKLEGIDKYEVLKEIKEALGQKLTDAYNKLDSNQKTLVDGAYKLIINS